ncbi:TPA: hypothetical protein N0F65_006147 [Lagenidium giganteum]|uniref:Uncharacterized protein n=1 Tax=Lagenidium giganteum TaxID=4803 RepID=A0AAV2Z5C6_9STRA|nr:TPA: hypothetical protein N0F65_006147 [Lagenidium giganteum]
MQEEESATLGATNCSRATSGRSRSCTAKATHTRWICRRERACIRRFTSVGLKPTIAMPTRFPAISNVPSIPGGLWTRTRATSLFLQKTTHLRHLNFKVVQAGAVSVQALPRVRVILVDPLLYVAKPVSSAIHLLLYSIKTAINTEL